MYVLAAGGKTAAFILPPKTGSRSVERALRGLGAERVAGRHGVHAEALRDCDRVFATVRNPFDVLVSWYYYDVIGHKAGVTFEKWYREAVTKGRNSYLQGTTLRNADRASDHLRYEIGLGTALNLALGELGLGPVELDRVGAAADRGDYRGYFSTELRQRASDRFAADLQRFGYQF